MTDYQPSVIMITRTLDIDTRVYRICAVKKAAYRVAHKCTIALGAPDGDTLPLSVSFRPGTTDEAVDRALQLFHRQLLDEELRATIHAETDALRALILAQAYSRANLIEHP